MLTNPGGVASGASSAIAAAMAKKAAAEGAAAGSITTGATNSVTSQAQPIKTVQPVLARPVRSSDKEVLFVSSRATMNFVAEDNKRRGFADGFFLTADPAVIKHIKANATAYRVVETEEGPLEKKKA